MNTFKVPYADVLQTIVSKQKIYSALLSFVNHTKFFSSVFMEYSDTFTWTTFLSWWS